MVSISLPQKQEVFLGASSTRFKSFALINSKLIRSAYNDFGAKFTCVDPTGEQPLSGMIVSVDKVNMAYMSQFEY